MHKLPQLVSLPPLSREADKTADFVKISEKVSAGNKNCLLFFVMMIFSIALAGQAFFFLARKKNQKGADDYLQNFSVNTLIASSFVKPPGEKMKFAGAVL